eukprot:611995_1
MSMFALILTGNDLEEAKSWLQGNSDQVPSPDDVRELTSKHKQPVENFADAVALLEGAAANDGTELVVDATDITVPIDDDHKSKEVSEHDSDDDVMSESLDQSRNTPGALPSIVGVADSNLDDHHDEEKDSELSPTPGPSDGSEDDTQFRDPVFDVNANSAPTNLHSPSSSNVSG